MGVQYLTDAKGKKVAVVVPLKEWEALQAKLRDLTYEELSPEQANVVVMPILIAMLFIVPILMAYWYAPILVGLNNLTATEAMKLSFLACLKNMLPFLLYGLIFMLLLVAAIIPFGLGLLIAVPVMMTSLYASYVDVFQIEEHVHEQLT